MPHYGRRGIYRRYRRPNKIDVTEGHTALETSSSTASQASPDYTLVVINGEDGHFFSLRKAGTPGDELLRFNVLKPYGIFERGISLRFKSADGSTNQEITITHSENRGSPSAYAAKNLFQAGGTLRDVFKTSARKYLDANDLKAGDAIHLYDHGSNPLFNLGTFLKTEHMKEQSPNGNWGRGATGNASSTQILKFST